MLGDSNSNNTQTKTENKSSNQIVEQVEFIEEKSEYGILGQIFDCYLLVKVKNSLIIIDQHAAHERLIFDELIQKTNDGNVAVQQLLLPYVKTFSNVDFSRILASSVDYKNNNLE